MKKSSKILALILVLALALSMALAGCTGGGKTNKDSSPAKEYKELTYAKDTELRMATGYNNAQTGIAFNNKIAGDGLLLPDGVTYHTGDLKPTWKYLESVLNVKFHDEYTGKSASNTYEEFKDKLETVDMVSCTASQANEVGEDKFINIADYLDYMPNFDKYLNDNPIVRLSITGKTSNGAIYFSPYFDGSDDIERMPLMRVDMVEKLLNGAGQFTAAESATTKAPVYTPYMPTSGKVDVQVVDSVSAAGQPTVRTISKDYSKYGNIIAKMNEKGTMTGVEAVNMLREYIDKTYNNYYGENRANLFIGQNAAWDADEMVALLRCVVANSKTLNGTDTIQGLFSREDNNNQRRIDLFRFAGILFGVRGLESRQDYLYFGKDGKLYDARNSADTYDALEKMNAMRQEGLISVDYNNEDADNAKSSNYITQSTGFMSYDYNQTQTIYNKTVFAANEETKNNKYMAVLVPVAHWYDGSSNDGVYMRFTESWRSVKTDAWAISKAGVEGNQDKLFAALKLIDYAYSVQGSITMSYGPDAYIQVKDASVEVKTKADVAKKYNTFKFNGEDWPLIKDETYADLYSRTTADTSKGNYTNYARFFLGSTLSFLKSQAFEVQCTSEVGKEGAQQISYAIAAGIIKHPLLAVNEENMWYTSVPTVLPMTPDDNTAINSFANLKSTGKYSGSSSTGKNKGKYKNVLVDIIDKGFAGCEDFTTKQGAIDKANEWGVQAVLDIKNHVKESDDDANGPWARLLEYYKKLNG